MQATTASVRWYVQKPRHVWGRHFIAFFPSISSDIFSAHSSSVFPAGFFGSPSLRCRSRHLPLLIRWTNFMYAMQKSVLYVCGPSEVCFSEEHWLIQLPPTGMNSNKSNNNNKNKTQPKKKSTFPQSTFGSLGPDPETPTRESCCESSQGALWQGRH